MVHVVLEVLVDKLEGADEAGAVAASRQPQDGQGTSLQPGEDVGKSQGW